MIAVVLHYAHIAIPHVTQTNFVTLLIGYLVLLAGNHDHDLTETDLEKARGPFKTEAGHA